MNRGRYIAKCKTKPFGYYDRREPKYDVLIPLLDSSMIVLIGGSGEKLCMTCSLISPMTDPID